MIVDVEPGASAKAGATIENLHRGRIFVITLLALFTAGAAVSMRAATAVHMRSEYLDPLGTLSAGERLATVLGAAFAGFAITLLLVSAVLAKIGFGRALIAAASLLTAGFAIVAGAGALGLSPYSGLLAGMLVQGLGWGMVETVINPLTSALYPACLVSGGPGRRRTDGPQRRPCHAALALEHDSAGAAVRGVGRADLAGKISACQRLHRRASDAG
jgi:hypothetical protein